MRKRDSRRSRPLSIGIGDLRVDAHDGEVDTANLLDARPDNTIGFCRLRFLREFDLDLRDDELC